MACNGADHALAKGSSALGNIHAGEYTAASNGHRRAAGGFRRLQPTFDVGPAARYTVWTVVI